MILNLRSLLGFLLGAAFVASTGCKKEDPVSELEKTATAMAAAAPAPAAPDAGGTGAMAPADQVKEAITEYKAGKMQDAVMRLQLLRSATVLSPQQRMALQDSMAIVMQQIYAQAEKGDARAIAAVAQYEKMQTGGH